MAEDTIKVVKNKNTGVVFAYTDRLAEHKHMIVGYLNLKTQKFSRSDEPDEGSPMAAKLPDPSQPVTDPEPAAPEVPEEELDAEDLEVDEDEE